MSNSGNMFSTMFEVKQDQKLGKFLVHPMGTDKQNDYAILCSSEFEAKNICAQIAMQMLPSPDESPFKYHSKGLHPNGTTRLYSLK
jgi:hypothetical protein